MEWFSIAYCISWSGGVVVVKLAVRETRRGTRRWRPARFRAEAPLSVSAATGEPTRRAGPSGSDVSRAESQSVLRELPPIAPAHRSAPARVPRRSPAAARLQPPAPRAPARPRPGAAPRPRAAASRRPAPATPGRVGVARGAPDRRGITHGLLWVTLVTSVRHVRWVTTHLFLRILIYPK